jgi:hypothetical protein
MLGIAFIILIGFFSFSVASNILIWLSLKPLYQHEDRKTSLQADRHLVLVLRVYQETKNIEKAIKYIAASIGGFSNVCVIVVGTERERENGGNPTLSQASRLTSGLPNWRIVEAPLKLNGTHAHQTNFATKLVETDPHRTWVLTLDIDSEFGRDGLHAFIEQINDGEKIIQQHALFTSNFTRICWLQKAHAIVQSAWTIRHEMKRAFLNRKGNISVAHVVGHGLCINLTTLSDYGGFPEDTAFEDINLGFYLVSSGGRINSLPVLEIGDTPSTAIAGLRQEYSWSYAAMLYPAYFLHYRRKFPGRFRTNKIRALVFSGMGVWSYVRWLIGSWFALWLIYTAVNGNLLALACIISIAAEYTQAVFVMMRFGNVSWSAFVLAPVLVLVGIVRRSLPADMAWLDWLRKGAITKLKTPHD